MKTNRILLLVLLAACVAFAFGVGELLVLRIERGDVYPHYSSLRTDPLGSKAFHDSLAEIRALKVGRNYEPLLAKLDSKRATVLCLGAQVAAMDSVSENDAADVEQWIAAGGRLVLAFHGVVRDPSGSLQGILARKQQPAPDDGQKKRGIGEKPPVSLAQRWGVTFAYATMKFSPGNKLEAAIASSEKLDDTVSWHSALHFTGLNAEWHTLYTCGKNPVIIERRFGQGSIVLCADSYPFSNEALKNECASRLLAWSLGENVEIVYFDETHLGVADSPGIAALARKYRLHGLLAGLMALAGLFIWQSAARFVPPYHDPETADDLVSGKDSAAGLANLLRRGIAPGKLLTACFAEWKKSLTHGRHDLRARSERMEAALREASRQRHKPATPAIYQDLCRILAERDKQ